jgi:hypothetical protein
MDNQEQTVNILGLTQYKIKSFIYSIAIKQSNTLPVVGLPTSHCISSHFDPYFFKYSSSSFLDKSALLKYFLDGCYKEN